MKMLTREEMERMAATALALRPVEAEPRPAPAYAGIKAMKALEAMRREEYARYRYGGE